MANDAGPAKTSIGFSEQGWINARGHDLAVDVLGNFSFSGYFFLLLTGEAPTGPQQKALDLLLIASSDPGLGSAHQAARIASSSNPASLQLAMASGFLAAAPKPSGEVEACVSLLGQLKKEIYESDHSAAHVLKERVKIIKSERGSIPGFTTSPSAHDHLSPRLMELAEKEAAAHTFLALARQLNVEVGRTLEPGAQMSLPLVIAAIQLEFDLPAQLVRNLTSLAQAGTILAHMAEERVRPIAPTLLSAGDKAVEYDNQGS